MTFTITSQSGSTLVLGLVMGYESERESGNIVHRILGRADPEITLKPLRLRTGTLNLFMGSSAEAHTLVAQLAQLGWQYLDSNEEPLTNMHFVTSGSISTVSDDETETFSVSIGFQEVLL